MLERMTGGLYLSTPHRVRNTSKKDRYSFPLFFDPGFFSEVKPILPPTRQDPQGRWDQGNVHLFEGTYGQYILNKVAKVFPDL
jgi:polar amino acid transport system ATP-binding protein